MTVELSPRGARASICAVMNLVQVSADTGGMGGNRRATVATRGCVMRACETGGLSACESWAQLPQLGPPRYHGCGGGSVCGGTTRAVRSGRATTCVAMSTPAAGARERQRHAAEMLRALEIVSKLPEQYRRDLMSVVQMEQQSDTRGGTTSRSSAPPRSRQTQQQQSRRQPRLQQPQPNRRQSPTSAVRNLALNRRREEEAERRLEEEYAQLDVEDRARRDQRGAVGGTHRQSVDSYSNSYQWRQDLVNRQRRNHEEAASSDPYQERSRSGGFQVTTANKSQLHASQATTGSFTPVVNRMTEYYTRNRKRNSVMHRSTESVRRKSVHLYPDRYTHTPSSTPRAQDDRPKRATSADPALRRTGRREGGNANGNRGRRSRTPGGGRRERHAQPAGENEAADTWSDNDAAFPATRSDDEFDPRSQHFEYEGEAPMQQYPPPPPPHPSAQYSYGPPPPPGAYPGYGYPPPEHMQQMYPPYPYYQPPPPPPGHAYNYPYGGPAAPPHAYDPPYSAGQYDPRGMPPYMPPHPQQPQSDAALPPSTTSRVAPQEVEANMDENGGNQATHGNATGGAPPDWQGMQTAVDLTEDVDDDDDDDVDQDEGGINADRVEGARMNRHMGADELVAPRDMASAAPDRAHPGAPTAPAPVMSHNVAGDGGEEGRNSTPSPAPASPPPAPTPSTVPDVLEGEAVASSNTELASSRLYDPRHQEELSRQQETWNRVREQYQSQEAAAQQRVAARFSAARGPGYRQSVGPPPGRHVCPPGPPGPPPQQQQQYYAPPAQPRSQEPQRYHPYPHPTHTLAPQYRQGGGGGEGRSGGRGRTTRRNRDSAPRRANSAPPAVKRTTTGPSARPSARTGSARGGSGGGGGGKSASKKTSKGKQAAKANTLAYSLTYASRGRRKSQQVTLRTMSAPVRGALRRSASSQNDDAAKNMRSIGEKRRAAAARKSRGAPTPQSSGAGSGKPKRHAHASNTRKERDQAEDDGDKAEDDEVDADDDDEGDDDEHDIYGNHQPFSGQMQPAPAAYAHPGQRPLTPPRQQPYQQQYAVPLGEGYDTQSYGVGHANGNGGFMADNGNGSLVAPSTIAGAVGGGSAIGGNGRAPESSTAAIWSPSDELGGTPYSHSSNPAPNMPPDGDFGMLNPPAEPAIDPAAPQSLNGPPRVNSIQTDIPVTPVTNRTREQQQLYSPGGTQRTRSDLRERLAAARSRAVDDQRLQDPQQPYQQPGQQRQQPRGSEQSTAPTTSLQELASSGLHDPEHGYAVPTVVVSFDDLH